MRRTWQIIAAVLLLSGIARADQGWQDNQDGNGFACFDVSSFSANNLASGGATYSNVSTGEIVNSYPSWWSQTAWFVDPQNSSGLANDSNTGLTNTTPLRTWAELARRWDGAVLTGSTGYVINVMSDGNTTDNVVMNAQFATQAVGGAEVLGVPTVVYTGTVTTFTAASAGPTADDTEITDASLPTSFTASGLLADGLLAHTTSGSASWFYIAKDLSSKTARISVPCNTAGGSAALTGGQTYEVLRLPKIYGLQWPNMTGLATSFSTLFYDRIWDFAPTNNWQQALYARGWRGTTSDTSALMQMSNYAIGAGLTTNFHSDGAGLLAFNFGLVRGPILVENTQILVGGTVFETAPIQLQRGTTLVATSRFDVDDTSSGMLQILTGSAAIFSGSGNMSGIGNSGNLFTVATGGSVTYDSTPVTAASTSGTQVSINGTAYTVAALPVSDPNSGSGVRQSASPSYSAGCAQFTSSGILSSTGTACGSGSGGVSSVTGTAQRVETSPTTGAVVVDTIGGYYSGAVSGGNEDLGTTLTNGLVCDTTTAGVAVLRTCTSGTDYPAVGVATPGSCTNCSATVNANGQVTTYSSGTAPVTSIGVTAPITTTGGTAPTIGISLPANQVAVGTGTNVTSFSGLTYDNSVIKLAVAGTFAGPTTISVSNASAGTTSYADMALIDNLGNGSRADVYYTSSTYTGSDSSPSSLTFGTAAGSASRIIFSPNNVKSVQFTPAAGVLVTALAAPSTPASGLGAVYVDSTSKNLAVKNDAGTVNHGAQTQTAAAGKAFTALADGGSFTETSFQAPITPTACGATTFGTSISSAGAITCTQPAFTDIAGQWSCSQRPAASAPGGGNDVNNSSGSCVSTVVAIHDASVTQLVFGTIPDSNPQSTVLIRGAGSTSISGVAAGVIADTVTKHDYFINIQSLQPVDTSTRYLATSSSGTVLPGGVIESPNDFIAGHVGYKFYIIDSIGTASSMDCWVTLNGTLITGTDYNFTPGTTSPGVHTQATVATGSASASDTFGMACLYNGNFVTGPFGATIVFTVQLVLTP